MRLGLIVAIAENNVIGNKGKLPWEPIPGDLPRFKQLTMKKPVIMGRKTYESIPPKFRPLQGRPNIILTSKKIIEGNTRGIETATSIDEALEKARRHETEEAYLIGGARVYEEGIGFTNFMDITRIKGEYEGDVHFPYIRWKDWKETKKEEHKTHTNIRYERIV